MRTTVLATGQIYHVVNRAIDKRPIFSARKELDRALLTLSFYRFSHTPMRLSYLLKLPQQARDTILQKLEKQGEYRVDLLAFCLMPNHFHFLIRQNEDNATSRFLADFSNSYTRYYNTKHTGRKGTILEGVFRAVRIEDEEQLLHVSRYIHINPAVSYLVKTDELTRYPWSSFSEYTGQSDSTICQKDIILKLFKSKTQYLEFCLDQVDYGKKLERIKHLTLEE